MADMHRTVQELLSDYAGALRDGNVPVFLQSLTRQEGQTIVSSDEFWQATEVVRILNGVGFADKAATADVGLFLTRVDANVLSRSKKARTAAKPRRALRSRSQTAPRRAEETL